MISRLILFRIAMRLPRNVRQKLKRRYPELARFVIGIHVSTQSEARPAYLEDINFILSSISYNLPPTHKKEGCSVAFFSPWPPNKSGIAWHGEKFCDELGKFLNVDVFVSGNQNRDVVPSAHVFPIEFYPGKKIQNEYCYNLFNLGNGPDHSQSLKVLQEGGGTVILHDVRVPAIPTIHPRMGAWRTGPFGDLGCDLFPPNTKLILHSKFAESMLLTDPIGKEISKSVVPTGLPIYSIGAALRNFNGVIGMVGFFSTEKQPEIVASAFGRLSAKNPEYRFKFIGKFDHGLENHLLRIFEAAGGVIKQLDIHQDLNDLDYWKQIQTLGLAVQLRDRTNGESSGTAHEIQAQGIPVVCTEIGANIELPSDVFIKVPRKLTGEALASEINKVIENMHEYSSRSQRGIEWARNKTFDHYASDVLNIIGPCPIHTKEKDND